MNNGVYPDNVVNEAITLSRKGVAPKDIADILKEKHRLGGPHAKTVEQWIFKYPDGKASNAQSGLKVDFTIEGFRVLDSADAILGEGNDGDFNLFLNFELKPKSPMKVDAMGLEVRGTSVKAAVSPFSFLMKNESGPLVVTIPKHVADGQPKTQLWVLANGRLYISSQFRSIPKDSA